MRSNELYHRQITQVPIPRSNAEFGACEYTISSGTFLFYPTRFLKLDLSGFVHLMMDETNFSPYILCPSATRTARSHRTVIGLRGMKQLHSTTSKRTIYFDNHLKILIPLIMGIMKSEFPPRWSLAQKLCRSSDCVVSEQFFKPSQRQSTEIFPSIVSTI
jgi:hypothetical protein